MFQNVVFPFILIDGVDFKGSLSRLTASEKRGCRLDPKNYKVATLHQYLTVTWLFVCCACLFSFSSTTVVVNYVTRLPLFCTHYLTLDTQCSNCSSLPETGVIFLHVFLSVF
jgi:hypothetical protein